MNDVFILVVIVLSALIGAFWAGSNYGEYRVLYGPCKEVSGTVEDIDGEYRCWDRSTQKVLPITITFGGLQP